MDLKTAYNNFHAKHPELCLAIATSFCCIVWMVPAWRVPDFNDVAPGAGCVRSSFLHRWGTLLARIVVTVKPGSDQADSFRKTFNSAFWLFIGTIAAALWARCHWGFINLCDCESKETWTCGLLSSFFFLYFLEKVLWFGTEEIPLLGKVDWSFQTWAISSHVSFMMANLDPDALGFRATFACQGPTVYLTLACVATVFALYTIEAAYNVYALIAWIVIAVASVFISDFRGEQFYMALFGCVAWAITWLVFTKGVRRCWAFTWSERPQIFRSGTRNQLNVAEHSCLDALLAFVPFRFAFKDCFSSRERRQGDPHLAHFCAIAVSFFVGWSGALVPALPAYDSTMAGFIAMLLWQPGKTSKSCDNGKNRWLGTTIGPLVGFVMLASLYKYVPVLLCLAFLWELVMLYAYYKTLKIKYHCTESEHLARQETGCTSKILSSCGSFRDKILGDLLSTEKGDAVLPFALVATFSPSYMYPPQGIEPWAKVMTDATGIGWALAVQYRRAIAQFLSVFFMMSFELVFSFSLNGTSSSLPAFSDSGVALQQRLAPSTSNGSNEGNGGDGCDMQGGAAIMPSDGRNAQGGARDTSRDGGANRGDSSDGDSGQADGESGGGECGGGHDRNTSAMQNMRHQ
eukprot:TRINITY_DN18884_c0_g2_i1.p1 TRINITY_DN18884_c0_g2~~TRINITY_DN18884_c0_g2_i1.p1  ORF type:complete len:630 (+),score=55.43 TRINITY_DN18884_c0_g2_i1:71-1960(+)